MFQFYWQNLHLILYNSSISGVFSLWLIDWINVSPYLNILWLNSGNLEITTQSLENHNNPEHFWNQLLQSTYIPNNVFYCSTLESLIILQQCECSCSSMEKSYHQQQQNGCFMLIGVYIIYLGVFANELLVVFFVFCSILLIST